MIRKYNDNELLYLISENSEIAFEVLCEKYRPMIINRLQRFRIQKINFEDFYQECVMTLYQCAISYREDKSHTFNIYLDICIQNKIKSILRKEKNYFYNVSLVEVDDIDYFGYTMNKHLEESKPKLICLNKRLSSFERRVLDYINSGLLVDEIAVKERKNTRSIYNAISRLKAKETQEEEIKIPVIYTSILSTFESIVYQKYKQGLSPKNISLVLECDVNKIYNALKRIKCKISRLKND